MVIPTGRLARSAIATASILGGRAAVQAASLLLTVRLFDPSTYGQVVSTLILAVLLGLLPTLGAGFVMMARAPGNPNAAEDVWHYAWPLTMLIGVLLAAAYLPMSGFVAGDNPLPWPVVACFAMTEIMVTPMIGLISFALQSRERVSLSQVLQSLPFLLRLVALLPCFYFSAEHRLLAFAFSQLLASAVSLIVAYAVARRHVRLTLDRKRATRADLQQGLTFVSMHVVAANSTELDKVLATRLVGAFETGLYSVGARILIALMMPINAVLLAAQPRLFRHGHTPTEEGRRLIGAVGLVSVAWGIASGALLFGLSRFVPVIFGADYASATVPMAWMALVAPLMSMRFAASCILVAIGRPLDRMLFEGAGILVVVASLFTWAAGRGATGIVFAVGVAELTMLAMSSAMVLKRFRDDRVGPARNTKGL